MRKGKVQTNDYGVNVLVEHEDCSGHHYSHLDKDVFCEKMSESDINEAFYKLELSIDDKKMFLMRQKGFAISEVYSKENYINYSDLFKYKLQK